MEGSPWAVALCYLCGGEGRCLWMELGEMVRSRICTGSDALPMAMMLPTRLWPAHYFI